MNYSYNSGLFSNVNDVNMSSGFNTTTNDYFNVRLNYKEIGKNFCDTYYNLYDNDFTRLTKLYLKNCHITFIDEEIIGFNNFNNRRKLYGLTKFTHHSIDINSQPMNDDLMLINISGRISANDSIFTNRFSETIVLHKYSNNLFIIVNSVFKLLD